MGVARGSRYQGSGRSTAAAPAAGPLAAGPLPAVPAAPGSALADPDHEAEDPDDQHDQGDPPQDVDREAQPAQQQREQENEQDERHDVMSFFPYAALERPSATPGRALHTSSREESSP